MLRRSAESESLCHHGCAMKVVVTQFEGIDNTPALPLAAGILVATAKLDSDLAREAAFSIVVRREPIEQVVAGFGQPDVIGFSLYPWNAAYSLAVAAAAREAYPEALIVAGGPAVPRPDPLVRRLFREHSALDVLVFSEGELTFRSLLRAQLRGEGLGAVGGLAFRRGDEVLFTAPAERVFDFTQTASPYLDGTFDALLAEGRADFSMALVETNRGCPFSCTFCDWSLTKHVVEFPLERVRAELDWIADRGFSHMAITDANFGIRPRDSGIARTLAEVKRVTGRPTYCYFYLTKNNHRRNLETIEILHEAGIGCCVGLAVQDFDEDVLKAVKRDNIQSGESIKLLQIMGGRGIPTHNELILGLPRQTRASFANTLVTAMPSWPRHDFAIYLCLLLDNTELAEPQERERFGIETRRCRWKTQRVGWNPVMDEYQEVVVGTVDMPFAEWRRTYRLAYLASAIFNQRLLRVVLQWLTEVARADLGAYLLYLCALTEEAPEGSVFADLGRVVDRYLDSIAKGGPLALPMSESEALVEVSEAVAHAALVRADAFFEEVVQGTQRFLPSCEVEVLEEAVRFQRLVTPRFGEPDPREEPFHHDWVTFTAAGGTGAPLQPRPIVARYAPPAYVGMPEFASYVTTHFACIRAHLGVGEVTRSERPSPRRLAVL